MIKTLKAVAIAALATVGVAQANVVNRVDLFTFDQATVVDQTVNGIAATSQVGPALDDSILGGYRELFADIKANGGNNNRKVEIGVSGGTLDFSVSTLAQGTGIVRWDGISQGVDINPTGLGAAGLNFANAFTDSFELHIEYADGVFMFSLEAYTDATHWSKVLIQANQHPVPAVTYIPLLAFLDCSNMIPGPITTCGADGAVDFSNLGALQAVIDPNGSSTALDLTLAKALVVPEPGALALVGLALAAAGVASSRRRKV